ncbi:PAIP2B [Branchiostoma lanceolatum]|uniref:PAIP2B protein n=1 Tax=Branchiostoma lanceolatum TaxID=7740 RepID=A0A8K0EP98_BRALA|nr:PAIP2B [Branchiostoma lanceolatum]
MCRQLRDMRGPVETQAREEVPEQEPGFEEFLWMENEEDYDRQVLQELWEEDFLEQCFQEMMHEEEARVCPGWQDEQQAPQQQQQARGQQQQQARGPVPQYRYPGGSVSQPCVAVNGVHPPVNGVCLQMEQLQLAEGQQPKPEVATSTLNPNAPEFVPKFRS